jgi:HEAT repeat protein
MSKKQKGQRKLDRRTLRSYLDRQIDGKILSPEELDDVAADFSNPKDLYTRMLILQRSGDPRFIPVFEKFVTDTDDLDVAARALRALICSHGRLEYVPLLKKYIEGVNWDPDEDLKLHAVHIADHYLEKHEDQSVLALLIKQFEVSENRVVREAAHEALMSVAGIDRSDVQFTIAACGMTESDLRLDVIERLKKRLLDS